jgi:hypothetical protein
MKTRDRFMGSVQFHWHCIMPMNLTLRAADCKSALRGRFVGSPLGHASMQSALEGSTVNAAPSTHQPSTINRSMGRVG